MSRKLVVKHKGQAKKLLSKESERSKVYKSSFDDIEPGTCYWDPLGVRIREKVNLKKSFYEASKPWIETWNKVQKSGDYMDLRHAIMLANEGLKEKVAKANLATSRWAIPLYFLPDVLVNNPGRTPMSDLLPRQTTDSSKINVTTQPNTPSVTWGLEGSSYGAVDYSNPYYSDTEYSIYGYGLDSVIEDKMILASRSLRPADREVEALHMKAMRNDEESQILYGTNHESGGFNGFQDIQTSELKKSTVANLNIKEDLRKLRDEVRKGGSPDDANIVFVTNFTIERKLKNALEDHTRHEVSLGGNEWGFEKKALEFDGSLVLVSTAIPESPSGNKPYIFAVDMGDLFMGMLQDVTMKPLAKTDPQENVATDAYGALACGPANRIQYIEMA